MSYTFLCVTQFKIQETFELSDSCITVSFELHVLLLVLLQDLVLVLLELQVFLIQFCQLPFQIVFSTLTHHIQNTAFYSSKMNK